MLVHVRLSPIRRCFGLFTIFILFLSAVYVYLNYVQNIDETDLWSNSRCLSELNSLKYQLNVVTEYKSRLDKLLTETQRKCDVEKERFKEIMESCLAMKQQTFICQSQFEDLQVECQKVKEQSDKLKIEIEKLKPAR